MLTVFRLPAAAVLLTVSVSTVGLTPGCTNQPYSSPQEAAQNACRALGPKAISGALIGGLGGAALGAGIGAAAGGGRGAGIGAGIGLLGGLVTGLAVGSRADQRDCAAAQAALAQMTTQPVGVPAMWRSPSGSYGSYTPTGPEYAQGGQFCRPVRESTNIVGHAPVQSGGVACRDANGDYQTMTETAANTAPTNSYQN
jgi:surface antigen